MRKPSCATRASNSEAPHSGHGVTSAGIAGNAYAPRFRLRRTCSRSRVMRSESRTSSMRESSSCVSRTGKRSMRSPFAIAAASSSKSKPKPSTVRIANSRFAASVRNAFRPHCESRNGSPIASRVIIEKVCPDR